MYKFILMITGAIVDLGENQGRTPFHLATENGDLPIIKLLVGHKADVNTNDANGWGPVHFASREERDDVLDVLMDRGADLGKIDGV